MRLLALLFLLVGSTPYAFAQIPKPEKRDAGWEARLWYELERTVDPQTGELPPDIKRREYEFTSKLPTYRDAIALKGQRTLGVDWDQIGPTGQPGRMRTFAIDVANPQNFLAGAASGGVWRSIDKGASWVKVTPANELQLISSIAQDKRVGKTATWYYGTSELLSTTNRRHTTNIRTHGLGNGIYRSTDNGTTWAVLPSTQTTGSQQAPVHFQGVWKVVVDHTKTDQDVIYAACMGGIMRSTNGGADWALVLGSDTSLCFNSDIVISTNGILYAGLGSVYSGVASPKQGIWRSTNGTDWEKMTPTLPALIRRIRLAVAPSADTVAYAFIERPTSWANPDGTFSSAASLYRYGGNKWSQGALPNGGTYFTLTGYAMAIAVHPTDPNHIFYAGTDAYQSIDGGKSFQWIAGYVEEIQGWNAHPDFHELLFDPHDPTKLFAATDGGIHSCTNPDELPYPQWTEYHSGLETSQIYDVKIDRKIAGNKFIACGLQDNGSYITDDPSTDWYIASGGDGMTAEVIDGINFFTLSSQAANIYFFGYDGVNINYYGTGHPPASSERFTFFTRYLVDPKLGNAMYLPEANDLWLMDQLQQISASGAVHNNWEIYSAVGDAVGLANIITSLAQTENSPLFLGTSNARIYKLADPLDLSAIPEDISSDLFPPNGYLAHIEVDPQDAQHIIAVFSNYNVQSIFRTIDGGASWTAISGNLEETPEGAGAGPSLRSVRILHTPNGIHYFAATTSGLFSTGTINGSATQWVREGASSIGNLIVESIDVRQSDGWVVAATQGGGIYAGTSTGAEVDIRAEGKNLRVEQSYPNPMQQAAEISFSLSEASSLTIELYDVLGTKLSTLSHTTYPAGDHTYQLTGTELSAGAYFYRFIAGNEKVTKMFSVVK